MAKKIITVVIELATQTLSVQLDGISIKEYKISSAKNGAGEVRHSQQTPRGWHIIRAKIGGGCRANTVFVSRRVTGEMYIPPLRQTFPNRDWILTRILWLSGLERGKNRLGEVDTMRRYIYIHGTPDDVVLGVPGSHGCIRMQNDHIIDLYEMIPVGTRVFIHE